MNQRETCRDIFPKLEIMTLYSIYIFEMLKFVKSNETLFLKNEDVHNYIKWALMMYAAKVPFCLTTFPRSIDVLIQVGVCIGIAQEN